MLSLALRRCQIKRRRDREPGETLFKYVIVVATSSMTPDTKPYEKQRTNLDLRKGRVSTRPTTNEIGGGRRGTDAVVEEEAGERTPRIRVGDLFP